MLFSICEIRRIICSLIVNLGRNNVPLSEMPARGACSNQ